MKLYRVTVYRDYVQRGRVTEELAVIAESEADARRVVSDDPWTVDVGSVTEQISGTVLLSRTVTDASTA